MFNLNIDVQDSGLQVDKLYDLIIIGSGPAGLSAALYAARKGLEVGLIGDKVGGQVQDTSSVENYMGFDFITGQGLATAFEDHLKTLPVDMMSDVRVKSIDKEDDFLVRADNYQTYKSKSVLLASGSKSRKLGVEGEDTLYGRGVTYCAICDGPLFKGKVVTVVGGGNSAVEAAIDLSKIASQVHLVHRSEFRADQVLVDRLEALKNVEIHLASQVESIHGQDQVEYIQVTGQTSGRLDTQGVLVEIGYVPNSQFVQVDKNHKGEILIDQNHQTSIPGMFAAGDVTSEPYKQIIVAASEGAKAALSINHYLNNL
jgi:alkyl hydroperoxide reductase subunit F